MTPGHRVARVQSKDRRVAKRRYPWAQTIVRVGSTLVCYESPEDAGEEHAPVTGMRNASAPMVDFRDHFGRIGGRR